MADFEKSLVSRILHSGEVKDVLDRKIHEGMIVDERNRKVFIFILNYYNKYGEIPTMEVMDNEFPDYDIIHTKLPINYCIDKVIEQYIRNKGSDIIVSNTSKIVADPLAGLDSIRGQFNNLTLETNPTNDSNFIDSIKERKERYLKVKELEGIDGYHTPWYPLSKATGGWHAEELSIIVSRTGIGKSWMLLKVAEHAWLNGLSILFITNEMSIYQIERRLDAIYFKLPYSEFTEGMLPDTYEENYFSQLEELKEKLNMPPMNIVSDVGGVSTLNSKIDQYKPDILLIDGMYLLADDKMGKSKWERIANISWDLKKLSVNKKLPIITTTQFNKTAEGFRFDEVTLFSLGFSDSIGYDVSNAVAIFQNKDMKANNEMYVRLLKVREGEAKDFTINWDLRRMDFSVLREDNSNEVIEDGELDEDEIDY